MGLARHLLGTPQDTAKAARTGAEAEGVRLSTGREGCYIIMMSGSPGRTLPDVQDARTPQPPSTPLLRPASGRRHVSAGAHGLPLSSQPQAPGRPSSSTSPRKRPTTPNGRAVTLSRIRRPSSASASPYKLVPRSPEEVDRLDAVVQTLTSEAWDFLARENYAAAVTKFGEAIDITPSNSVLYSSRAIAHLELGHVDAAITDCEACIAVAPGRKPSPH